MIDNIAGACSYRLITHINRVRSYKRYLRPETGTSEGGAEQVLWLSQHAAYALVMEMYGLISRCLFFKL